MDVSPHRIILPLAAQIATWLKRKFDLASAMTVTTATADGTLAQGAEDGQEARLYCYSEAREQKEKAIAERFAKRFENALTTLSGQDPVHKNASIKSGNVLAA